MLSNQTYFRIILEIKEKVKKIVIEFIVIFKYIIYKNIEILLSNLNIDILFKTFNIIFPLINLF